MHPIYYVYRLLVILYAIQAQEPPMQKAAGLAMLAMLTPSVNSRSFST